ncbi:16233_t:CDS:2 [Gigaspora margarita]|uniref:16233_t:CDS:1 n=1 Tax=Gigaspora margarita TaxID=4874 RepID=A0ABN7WEU5_GIGMA|nr:16233_t:CDS:2 [Gigaspora margarita]
MAIMNKTITSINKSSSSQLPETINTSVKRKADKTICHYCDRGKWQRGKPFTIEAHLALHCKGPVPDDIRRRWLIEVAKRGKKANDDRDDEFPIKKKPKPINQSLYITKVLAN